MLSREWGIPERRAGRPENHVSSYARIHAKLGELHRGPGLLPPTDRGKTP